MNRIKLKVPCFLLAFAFLMTNLSSSFMWCFADEGLSDSQLYGYGSENVLGHKKKSSPVTPRYNNASVETTTDKVTTEDVLRSTEDSEPEPGKDSKLERSLVKSPKIITKKSEVNEEVDLKIVGVEDDHYYNDDLDISIDVSGLSSGDAVDAVVFRKAFDGNSLRHNMIVNTDEDMSHAEEMISDEGEYNLDVQVSRGVEVLKHTSKKFVLDKTPPVFDETMFNEMTKDQIDVAYLVSNSFTDNSPLDTSIVINDSKVEGGVITEPGEYDVTLKASDKAGNVSDINKNVVIENVTVKKNPVKQNMYHQLIGITLLVGSSLFYLERKKMSN